MLFLGLAKVFCVCQPATFNFITMKHETLTHFSCSAKPSSLHEGPRSRATYVRRFAAPKPSFSTHCCTACFQLKNLLPPPSPPPPVFRRVYSVARWLRPRISWGLLPHDRWPINASGVARWCLLACHPTTATIICVFFGIFIDDLAHEGDGRQPLRR